MGQLRDYFITFGYGHPGFPGYVRITAPDLHTARALMFEHYGEQWMTDYPDLSHIDPLDRIERNHLVYTSPVD